MRTIFTFALFFCLFLAPRAYCGPSVGGGDDPAVEDGRVPDEVCRAMGGTNAYDLENREPHGGGEDLTDSSGNRDAGRSNEVCATYSNDL